MSDLVNDCKSVIEYAKNITTQNSVAYEYCYYSDDYEFEYMNNILNSGSEFYNIDITSTRKGLLDNSIIRYNNNGTVSCLSNVNVTNANLIYNELVVCVAN